MSGQYLLALDIGTTHYKAGLFAYDGAAVAIATRLAPVEGGSEGRAVSHPDAMWQIVQEVIGEVWGPAAGEPAALGIAGMAESGLLVDRASGAPRSDLILWADTTAARHAEHLSRLTEPLDFFARTGQRISYKTGLAKLLSLRELDDRMLDGAAWLSIADYVAYRLTGRMATDPTLAARTGAYRIDEAGWDAEWLATLGLSAVSFPQVLTGGEVMGRVTASAARELGFGKGLPVSIAGHDHVCAALAAGALREGVAFDSMGTAESLVGAAARHSLDRLAFESGLVFGCSPGASPSGAFFWMGALSAGGASLDWLRNVFGDPALTYEQITTLLDALPPGPGDLVFYPYLLGAQAPLPDPRARAAFFGLRADHGRGDLVRGVLEGVAYEVETIRRAAEPVIGTRIKRIVAGGGGTRIPGWLQTKADLSGYPVEVSPHPEPSLLGAALLGGVGAGAYGSVEEAESAVERAPAMVFVPDARRFDRYNRILETVYLPLQRSVREASRALVAVRHAGG